MNDRHHPIHAVGTAVTGLVGVVPAGQTRGSYIHTWSEFTQRWPGDCALARAAEEYFRNGGSIAWIAPVARLGPNAVRRAIEAMDRDVSVVAVIDDPSPPPDVIAAAAGALATRRAMLLVEGTWNTAAEAIAEMSADRAPAVGATGPNVAVYWPRLRRATGAGTTEEVSSLGAVAGVIARTDATRGVFVAPAGSHAGLAGAIEPGVVVTRAEQDSLNALGVNVIRRFAQTGTVVWGARTQATDAEWRYVPVRRSLLFIEESIDRGLEWVVFEPNDESLWRQVRRSAETFLLGLFQQGAFAGSKPEHAFFVRCDGTTMTQHDLDNGRLVCMIGVAPVRPSEFVIFRIGRWTADADD